MIENRPFLTFITHLMLIIGVAMVAFPIWITFVAASHDDLRMTQVPLPLLPGGHFWENMKETLFGSGQAGAGSVAVCPERS